MISEPKIGSFFFKFQLTLLFVKKKIFITILACFLIVQTTYSQSSEENHNLAISYDQKRIERIDRVVNEVINNSEISGAVVLVNHNGRNIFHKSFGYSDIASQKKMELNSIFRIASMTKAITTVGVMILYERGHFLLNDPISKFIPEFQNPEIIVAVDSIGHVLETKPAKREIRIIDLLTHTSGIAYPFLPTKLQQVYKKNNLIDAVTEQDILLKNEIKKLAQLPLLFEPGSQYQYGLSIDVLGYLCEVITEKSLDKFLEDEIFIPLKMVDTQFYLPVEKTDRLVKLYSWDSGKLVESKGDESAIKIDNVNFPFEGAKTYFSGGGGLTSTVSDYSRFTQMLLNKGEFDGVQLLSRKTVELITKPKVDIDNDKIPDISIGGFYVIQDIVKRGEMVGSEGAYIGSGAFYGTCLVDPKENLTVVFMSQVLPGNSNVSERLGVLVYQALK